MVDNADGIPFDRLPSRFVIKTTFGGDSDHVVFYDRATSDLESVRETCREWLKEANRIHGKVYIEELLLDGQGRIPNDYKIYVFNGRARYLVVVCDRFSTKTFTYFDLDGNKLDMSRGGRPIGQNAQLPSRSRMQAMIQSAERLAKGFPLVRVDLYDIADGIYFGELTFCPGRGMLRFVPQRFDFEFGAQLVLPSHTDTWRIPKSGRDRCS